jgi:hypothetical protein
MTPTRPIQEFRQWATWARTILYEYYCMSWATRIAADGIAAALRTAAAALRAGRSLAAAFRAAGRAERATLRQQVERLSGQVTCLDADYSTLAATSRALELMRQQGRQRGPERDSGPSR